jgi:peptide/nickel transport system permease protein
MTGYVARRLVASVVLLLGVTFITFVLFFQIPENPGYMLVGPPHPTDPVNQARYDKALEAANHQLGVDKPLYIQYFRYLDRLRQGSLGTSFSQQDVGSLLWPAAQITAILVAGGMILLLLIAIPLGLVAGLHAGRALDRVILTVTLIGVSIPPYIIAYTLFTQLEPRLGMMQHGTLVGEPDFPITGYCPAFGGAGSCGGVDDWARHLIMPWIAFALVLIGLYVRMIRAGILELIDEPFVQTARAKGASEARVMRVHVLRNLWPALATMLSMDIGLALGLALFVEVAFGLPGLGFQTYQAILSPFVVAYDLPIVAGVVVIAATVVVLLNLLVDIVAATLDPRIRLVKASGGR